jgi:hypothetical protein
VRGQTSYRWYGRFVGGAVPDSDPATWGQCAHAIRVPGNASAYEVGVVQTGPGTYSLRHDSFCEGFGLIPIAGHGLARLKTEYAYIRAARRLQADGYTQITRTIDADGRTVIRATR